jgi:hypothetical protein
MQERHYKLYLLILLCSVGLDLLWLMVFSPFVWIHSNNYNQGIDANAKKFNYVVTYANIIYKGFLSFLLAKDNNYV